MMRLAWTTDIHFNFLDDNERRSFLGSLATEPFDAIAISGDIGQSDSVVPHLRELDERLRRPIYFVLGNHDYYGGSIAETRREVSQLARESRHQRLEGVGGLVEGESPVYKFERVKRGKRAKQPAAK
jgi:predicted MPP superfamily phosphohydrolase